MYLQPPLGRGGTSQVTSVASRSSEALKYQSEIATAQPHHTAGCITPAAPPPRPSPAAPLQSGGGCDCSAQPKSSSTQERTGHTYWYTVTALLQGMTTPPLAYSTDRAFLVAEGEVG